MSSSTSSRSSTAATGTGMRPSAARRRFARPTEDEEHETLTMRLLAAVIAIPIFELSLYISLALVGFTRRSGALLYMHIPLWGHAALVGTACVVGLLFGFRGITGLLGHLFLTHTGRERNETITCALWAGLLVLAGLLYQLTD